MHSLYIQFFQGAVLLLVAGIAFVWLVMKLQNKVVTTVGGMLVIVLFAGLGMMAWFDPTPSVPTQLLVLLGFDSGIAPWLSVLLLFPFCLATPAVIADYASGEFHEAFNRFVVNLVHS